MLCPAQGSLLFRVCKLQTCLLSKFYLLIIFSWKTKTRTQQQWKFSLCLVVHIFSNSNCSSKCTINFSGITFGVLEDSNFPPSSPGKSLCDNEHYFLSNSVSSIMYRLVKMHHPIASRKASLTHTLIFVTTILKYYTLSINTINRFSFHIICHLSLLKDTIYHTTCVLIYTSHPGY